LIAATLGRALYASQLAAAVASVRHPICGNSFSNYLLPLRFHPNYLIGSGHVVVTLRSKIRLHDPD
jgi:hypothetical protein